MDGEEKMPEKKPLNADNLMKFAYDRLTEYEAMRLFQATLQEMHDCLPTEEEKKGFFKQSRTRKDKPPVTRETLLPYADKPEWETVSHFQIKRDTLRRKARQLDIQLQWDSKSASSAAAGTSRSSVGTTKSVAAVSISCDSSEKKNDKKKGIKKEESSLLSESATGPPKKKKGKKKQKKHSKSKAAKKKKGKKRRKKKHSNSKDAKKKGKMEEKEESESSSYESESSTYESESSSYESDSSSYESDSSSSESEAPKKKKGKKRRKKRHSKSKAAKKKKPRNVKANEAPNELRFLVECLVPEKQSTFSITLRKEEWKFESLMLRASTSAGMVPGKFVLIYKGRDGALFSLENSASMEACVNMALESGGEEVALRLVKS